MSARQELTNYWGDAVLATFVYYVIAYSCNIPSALTRFLSLKWQMYGSNVSLLLSILVVLPLVFGFQLAFLHFVRGDKEDMISQIFGGFKTYGRAIAVQLLQGIFIFLWCLLLIIPGIIKFFSYAMTIYIAKDHPELGANECIDRSIEMMRGHKTQLFLMFLGFFGLAILCVFTLGIAFLWLIPYIQVCLATFYENLKLEEGVDVYEKEESDIDMVIE